MSSVSEVMGARALIRVYVGPSLPMLILGGIVEIAQADLDTPVIKKESYVCMHTILPTKHCINNVQILLLMRPTKYCISYAEIYLFLCNQLEWHALILDGVKEKNEEFF